MDSKNASAMQRLRCMLTATTVRCDPSPPQQQTFPSPDGDYDVNTLPRGKMTKTGVGPHVGPHTELTYAKISVCFSVVISDNAVTPDCSATEGFQAFPLRCERVVLPQAIEG